MMISMSSELSAVSFARITIADVHGFIFIVVNYCVALPQMQSKCMYNLPSRKKTFVSKYFCVTGLAIASDFWVLAFVRVVILMRNV